MDGLIMRELCLWAVGEQIQSQDQQLLEADLGLGHVARLAPSAGA